MLPFFLKAFILAGGQAESRRVTDLKSLAKEFDVVVHCTGLGARELVPDVSVYPIRGQVLRVKTCFISLLEIPLLSIFQSFQSVLYLFNR